MIGQVFVDPDVPNVNRGFALITYAVQMATWQDWLGVFAALVFVGWIAYERWLMEQPPDG